MKPSVFVIMPFDEKFDNIYDYLIHDPLSEAGYDVKRADNILNQQNILKDIIQLIITSDLIVADLSIANPNVYYELGIAHSYRKNVILLAQNVDELPFDLRSYRNISYSISFDKMNEARQEFKKLIESVQTKNVTFGNPVSDFSSSIPTLSTYDTQSQEEQEVSDNQDDRGLIDYNIEFQDSIVVMTQVIEGVGDRLGALTLDIESATDRLEGPEKDAPRKQRKTMQSLADNFGEFTLWLQDKNSQYRHSLGSVGQSLDALLSGEFEVMAEDQAELYNFVQELVNTEEAMIELHSGCSELVATMDAISRIEKNFHRAKRLMASEIEIFMDNIDQTQSTIIRARNVAKKFIDPS